MSTWRCPHCGTIQVESAKCFLCQRSATSCGTCVMFRPSFVGGLGYCANDRRREPLSGSEQRACWTGTAVALTDGFFDATPAQPHEHGLLEVKPVSGH